MENMKTPEKEPSLPKKEQKEKILGGTIAAFADLKKEIKESVQARKSAEEIKEKNYKALLAEVKKLKNGKGVGFVTKYTGEFSILKKGKDSYYTVDDKGRKSTFSSRDLTTRVLGISQLVPENQVAFVDPMELPSATIEEGSLYASNVEDTLKNSPSDEASLENDLQQIANLHKKRNLAHTYEVAPNYKIVASGTGKVELKQGNKTIAVLPKERSKEGNGEVAKK